MEQYTNNLEELVKERTNDYLLEKKKSRRITLSFITTVSRWILQRKENHYNR